MASMKRSEINKAGKQIVEKVFAPVLLTKDKEVWKKALQAATNHIDTLKMGSISDYDPKTIWEWESAHYQLMQLYKKKFIKLT